MYEHKKYNNSVTPHFALMMIELSESSINCQRHNNAVYSSYIDKLFHFTMAIEEWENMIYKIQILKFNKYKPLSSVIQVYTTYTSV